MRAFIEKQQVYIKSSNSTKKIRLNYTYSLILFTILVIIANIGLGNRILIIPLLKSVVSSLIFVSVFDYIINIILKKYDIKKIYNEDNIEQIGIIIGLFSINVKLPILLLAALISVIIKKVFKKINISSALYGIFIIYIYKYFNGTMITPLTHLEAMSFKGTYEEIVNFSGNILDYLFGINNLSPIISIMMFIYLFHKKSIKYIIVTSYTLTIFIIMLIYGIFNDMNVWFGFFQFLTGNLIFLSVYGLADYQITPTITEGQIIYGILLGLITSILRFIIPEISVIVTLIICPLIFTNIIERISPKLKYNSKLYYLIIAILTITSILIIAALTFLI